MNLEPIFKLVKDMLMCNHIFRPDHEYEYISALIISDIKKGVEPQLIRYHINQEVRRTSNTPLTNFHRTIEQIKILLK